VLTEYPTASDIARRLGYEFCGVCRCGHAFAEHHNAMMLSVECLSTLPPGARPFVAEECEYYGCNEDGGFGPDGRHHCHRYVDRNDPNPPDPSWPNSRGTFTRRARAMAWLRFWWKAAQVIVLRRDRRQVFRRERW
jgi:hypothetical protein